MKLRFTKMHGAGNDFVVIDATRERFAPTPALLQRLTDRRFGVGCDQVLVIEAASTPDVDFDYRIFNADGSEVGQCGNGSRAFALYVAENGLSDKQTLRVRTTTSVIELTRIGGGGNLVRVDMGAPRFVPDQIPLKLAQSERYRLEVPAFGSVEFGAVSMGNPHAVIVVDDVDSAPVEILGRALQASPEFPQSVNVGFLQVLGRDAGRLRVYERGAGETLACGTGACAAAVVGRLWGLFDDAVTLKARGGDLRLEWAGGADDSVFMTGPAETVFTGEIEWQK